MRRYVWSCVLVPGNMSLVLQRTRFVQLTTWTARPPIPLALYWTNDYGSFSLSFSLFGISFSAFSFGCVKEMGRKQGERDGKRHTWGTVRTSVPRSLGQRSGSDMAGFLTLCQPICGLRQHLCLLSQCCLLCALLSTSITPASVTLGEKPQTDLQPQWEYLVEWRLNS